MFWPFVCFLSFKTRWILKFYQQRYFDENCGNGWGGRRFIGCQLQIAQRMRTGFASNANGSFIHINRKRIFSLEVKGFVSFCSDISFRFAFAIFQLHWSGFYICFISIGFWVKNCTSSALILFWHWLGLYSCYSIYLAL